MEWLLPESSRSTSSTCSSRPISRNTPFSMRNCSVFQLVCSVVRSRAVNFFAPTWPVTRPATTTATTPEASAFSAGRKARNGTTKLTAVVSTGSRRRDRSHTLP